jgi:hypothetical protein
MPTVRAIVRDAAKDDYRFVSIVSGIVNSPAFQMQMTPEGTGGAPPTKQASLGASGPSVPLASAQRASEPEPGTD